MDSGEVLGAVSIFLSVAGSIFAACNHKRLRSNCCGRKVEASIDVETTTPPRSGQPKSDSEAPPPIQVPVPNGSTSS